jgi:hypothetical protein
MIVVIMAFLGWACYMLGCGITQSQMKNEAVQAGCAEYFLDDKHHRQFRWKGGAQ